MRTAEDKLGSLSRKMWKLEIVGQDKDRGVWNFNSNVTTKAMRNRNLDNAVRTWLTNVFLARHMRDSDLQHESAGLCTWPYWQAVSARMWQWAQLYNRRLQEVRLGLVLIVNFLVLYFTDSRANIQRRSSPDTDTFCEERGDCCQSDFQCIFSHEYDHLQHLLNFALGLPIVVLRLQNWVLGRSHGLRASAQDLRAETLSSSGAWGPKSQPCPWGDSLA